MKPKKAKPLVNKKSCKTEDGAAEIFVLPPGVLQKLGINLNIVESSQECPIDVTTKVDLTTENNPHCSINNNIAFETQVTPKEAVIDKTILETADLMKQSVFLSPTFVGVDFTNPRELEITNNTIEPQKHLLANGFHPSGKESIKIDNINIDEMPFILDKPYNEGIEVQSNYGSENTNLTASNTASPSQKDLVTLNDILGEPTKLKLNDLNDHPDEAYLSDCSNSNSGCLEGPNAFLNTKDSFIFPTATYDTKKIKIISEEMVNPSKFNEMKKSLHPNGLGFLKIPLRSVINSRTHIENVQYKIIENETVSEKSSACELRNDLDKLVNPFNTETVLLFGTGENETSKISIDNNLKVRDLSTGACTDVKIEYTGPDPKTCTSESNLSISIDFVVNDIDMRSKDEDTEATLESFVNEITSSDSDGIMKKIEESERDSPIKGGNRIADTLQTIDEIHFDPVVVNDINCAKLVSLRTDTEMKKCKVDKTLTGPKKYRDKYVDTKNADEVQFCHFEYVNNAAAEISNTAEKLTEPNVSQQPSELCHFDRVIEFDKMDNKNGEDLVDINVEIENEYSAMMELSGKEGSKKNIFQTLHAKNLYDEKQLTEFEVYPEKQRNETTEIIKAISGHIEKSNVFETDTSHSIEYCETVNSVPDSKMATYEDKVKEIAMVLMEFAKTHSHFGTLKAIPTYERTAIKLPAEQSQSNPLKLKTHIQGVEKPGGYKESCRIGTTPIFKTYGKSNKLKPQIFFACVDKTSKTEMHRDLTELDIPMNVNPEDVGRSLEFCLCEDFGSMAYYDSKIAYEHIHFWEHKIIDCDRENIFSIYKDSETSNTSEENMDVRLELVSDDSSKCRSHSICWHSYNKIGAPDVILNECEVVGHINKHMFCWLCGKAPQLNKDNITINDQSKDNNVKEVHRNSLEIIKLDASEQRGIEELLSVSTEKKSHDDANKEKTKTSLMVASDLECDQCDQLNKETDSTVGKSSTTDEQYYKSCENRSKSWHIAPIDVEVSKEDPSRSKSVTKDNEINEEIVNKKAPSSTSKDYVDGSKRRRAEAGNKVNISNKKKRLMNAAEDLDNVESADNLNTAMESKLPANEPNKTENSSNANQNMRRSSRRKSSAKNISGFDNEVITSKDLEPPNKKSTKCGVCDFVLSEHEWEDHASQKHCFIAWRSGTTLNFDDPGLIEKLRSLTQEKNGFRCSFCDYQNKNAAKFLHHARKCVSKSESKNTKQNPYDTETYQGDLTTINVEKQVIMQNINECIPNEGLSSYDKVQCGVCSEHVVASDWIAHIAQKHHYMAWKLGDKPVDVASDEAIRVHLMAVINEIGQLKCPKCDTVFKQAAKYSQHVRKCTDGLDSMDISVNTKCSEGSVDYVDCSGSLVQFTKCGVCKQNVAPEDWINHIAQSHSYLAWKDEEQPLDLEDDNEVRLHLSAVLKKVGKLTCSKCGLIRKYAKKFNDHRKKCTGLEDSNGSIDTSLNATMDEEAVNKETTSNVNSSISTHEPNNVGNTFDVKTSLNMNKVVTCGVCKGQVTDWIGHIAEKHNYIAWKDGESVINAEDTFAVQRYLNDLSKEINGLLCPKCGFKRKYAIPYLQHVNYCDGAAKTIAAAIQNGPGNSKSAQNRVAKCALCQAEVTRQMWTIHIFEQHQYMAWQEGESFDLNNPVDVEKHLTGILKQQFYLQCYKCCSLHKEVTSYLKHVGVCKAQPNDNKTHKKKLTCALCWKEFDENKWTKHRMTEHYNVAWYVGGVPVNFKNGNTIAQLVDEYKAQYHQLKCNLCGVTRASAVGFFAHVVACNKTEQEIERYKNVCDICNKKYFYFYHNQHMAWHTQQVKAETLKEETEKQRVKEEVKGEEVIEGRGRKAALKARNIIRKFKDGHDYPYKCPDCSFGADSNEELKGHLCKGVKEEHFSDSDVSCKPEDESEESDDSDIDSDISAENNINTDSEDGFLPRPKVRIRDRVSASSLVPRFPHKTTSKSMIGNYGLEFLENHFISKDLFSNLRRFDCKPISDDKLPKYMPLLRESCKFQTIRDKWETLERFEAKEINLPGKGTRSLDNQVLFAGGYIHCIAWAPSCGDDDISGQYLAIVGHRDVDQPRHDPNELTSDPCLIQIWNFGDLKKPAKFVFGIAHDFGFVWAIDWCPSGARDSLPKDATEGVKRLGLLSMACANGSAYVFSVPYPSMVMSEDKKIYRLEPEMELKLAMSPERRLYQATSISWSKQNDHQFIVVGYSEGTTAYYDLNTESPFLKTKENNRIVLFPYYDERLHNSCVTGLDTYPSLLQDNVAGALCSSSVTGSCLLARPGVRPVKQQIYSAIADTQFQPFWPSAFIVGDEGNLSASLNEVEWWGLGRHFGGGSAAGACWRCGHVAIAPTPLLRVCYTHPIHRLKKGARVRETFGMIQMKQLSGKKRKLKNDDFQLKIEPTTYDEAIEKYGLELRLDQDVKDKTDRMPRESFPEKTPERFPLCEVTSMAFCPTAAHHRKLAVATHAGLVFLVTVRI